MSERHDDRLHSLLADVAADADPQPSYAEIHRRARGIRQRRRAGAGLIGVAAAALIVAVPTVLAPNRNSDTPAATSAANPAPSSAAPSVVGAPVQKHDCLDEGPRELTFARPDGTRLAGAAFGSGTHSVVLGHSYATGVSLCELQDYAKRLAALGYLVVAVDQLGFGLSEGDVDNRYELDLLAAAEEARRLGATKIVIGGSSLAGDSALVAGATRPAGVVGVFALSPSLSYPVDPLAAARTLTVPVLCVSATDDADGVAACEGFEAAAPGGLATVSLVAGSDHGRAMLFDPTTERSAAAAAVEDFLARAFAG